MVPNIVRSLVLLVLVIGMGLGATFVVANALSRPSLWPTPVVVRDTITSGAHTLSGTVSVASVCDSLHITTARTSTSTYEIRFSTWREPHANNCKGAAMRDFRTVVFAPSFGITFSATFNKLPLPIVIDSNAPIK